VQDPDPQRAGRAFSQAAVELALASYPGCTLTTGPGDASPFGVFGAVFVGQDAVDHVAVLPSGDRVAITPPIRTAEPERLFAPAPTAEPERTVAAPARTAEPR